jgi:hypothetical protein
MTLIALGPILLYFVYAQLVGWYRTNTHATGICKCMVVARRTTAVNELQWHPAFVHHQLIVDKEIEDYGFA